jgi:AcrR family transcriptional regulator
VTTYHHGELRPALLRAAAKILEKEGRDAISLRDLARRAGVSHNAPYRHFADRQALLAALAEEGFVLLAAELEGRPWREQAMAYLRFGLANPERFGLMFSRPVPVGLRRLVESDPVAEAIWAMVHGLTVLILAGHFAGEDPEALLGETLAAVRFAQRSA